MKPSCEAVRRQKELVRNFERGLCSSWWLRLGAKKAWVDCRGRGCIDECREQVSSRRACLVCHAERAACHTQLPPCSSGRNDHAVRSKRFTQRPIYVVPCSVQSGNDPRNWRQISRT